MSSVLCSDVWENKFEIMTSCIYFEIDIKRVKKQANREFQTICESQEFISPLSENQKMVQN